MPYQLACVLGLIIVSKGQVRFSILSIDGHIECKDVVMEQVLLHHVVEYRGDALLCELWVCHADDCFEATIENT